MTRAPEHRLREALSHLVDAEHRLHAAQSLRDEATKALARAQTQRNEAVRIAADLLDAEGGVVIHDGHSFERQGAVAVRIQRVARELHVEQTSLLPEAPANGQ